MKIAVTGATGLVGSNLAVLAVEQGHQVRCTHRKGAKTGHLAHLPIEWVEADLSKPHSLRAAFERQDAVFHCAAVVSFSPGQDALMQKANVDGTNAIMDAVKACHVPRLVHCSSVVTCAISDDGTPVDETRPWNFVEHGLNDGYAVTKRLAEELVLARAKIDVDAVVVNPTYMLGPFDPKPSSGKLIVDVARGRVPGTTEGYNNFVDVRDVCRGMLAACARGTRGERYILGGHDLTYAEIMHRIAKIANVAPPRFALPRIVARMAGWAGDLAEKVTGRESLINSVTIAYAYCKGYRFSSEKAKAALGYAPGPIEPAIADALAWFRANGHLTPA